MSTKPIAIHTSIVDQCELQRALDSTARMLATWCVTGDQTELDIRVRVFGRIRQIVVDHKGVDNSKELITEAAWSAHA